MTKSQNQQILEVLKNGHGITALYAQSQFGIMRLAARIADLKAEGHKIVAQKVKVRNRHGQEVSVAKYSLGAN